MRPKLKTIAGVAGALAAAVAVAAPAGAATFRVVITNITAGQISGPPIAITHDSDFHLFIPGAPASDGVAIMAEDAALATLVAELEGNAHVYAHAAGGMPLPPGQSMEIEVDSTATYKEISVAQMLVTTNDTFWAVHNVALPRGVGQSVTSYATAWDAGSEANTESCSTVPGPPCGASMVRDPGGAEGFVHVSDGIHGIADLAPAEFDWRNPTVKVAVTRVR
jgi:hypothetical protein